MIKHNVSDKYERIYNLAEMIAAQICSSLHYKMVYKAKLKHLSVAIRDGEKTDAMILSSNEEKYNSLFIIADEDLNDESWIGFCIGHEFAHLLFNRFDQLGDYCESDGSYAYTNVQRVSGEVIYGLALEELLCDYIAIDTVSKVMESDKRAVIDHLINRRSGRINDRDLKLTERILLLFAQTPLEEVDCYDDIIFDDGGMTQKNLLLYEAAHGYDMSSLIADYDEAMGKGAWMRLNQWIDKYYLKDSEADFAKVQAELNLYSLRFPT